MDANAHCAIKGYRVCPDALVISHLLFVDDFVVFCRVKKEEAHVLESILQTYKEALGQQVNLNYQALYLLSDFG